MKTRIKKKRNGKYYPQVRVNFFFWKTLSQWWGNLDVFVTPDGSSFVMCSDYRIYAEFGGHGYSTLERAQEMIDGLNKQGYLYEPQGVTPSFSDGYIHCRAR